MKTVFKEGEKVSIKGEKDVAKIVKIFPYGIVEVKMEEGEIRNIRAFELNKISNEKA
jgi:predicted DNA-binding antitoxin AbrB/MazE fold protein